MQKGKFSPDSKQSCEVLLQDFSRVFDLTILTP